MGIAEKRIRTTEEKKRKCREKQILAISLAENGHSVAEIAQALEISEGTVRNFLKEEKEND